MSYGPSLETTYWAHPHPNLRFLLFALLC